MPPPSVRSNSTAPDLSSPASSEAGLEPHATVKARVTAEEWRNPRFSRNGFLWPSLLVVLVLAIFPLIASLGLALSNLQLVQGGFSLKFIGLTNFTNLFFGADRTVFLGLFKPPTIVGWLVFGVGTGALVFGLVRYLRGGDVHLVGLLGRTFGLLFGVALLWMIANTLFGSGGGPGR